MLVQKLSSDQLREWYELWCTCCTDGASHWSAKDSATAEAATCRTSYRPVLRVRRLCTSPDDGHVHTLRALACLRVLRVGQLRKTEPRGRYWLSQQTSLSDRHGVRRQRYNGRWTGYPVALYYVTVLHVHNHDQRRVWQRRAGHQH